MAEDVLDDLPESLEAAETEHTAALEQIRLTQQAANEQVERLVKRAIFLEGVIKAWSKDG